jgi:phosphatidylserine synthase
LVCHVLLQQPYWLHLCFYASISAHVAVLIMVYGLSFLMVSNVRYYSFKEVRWLQQHPFSGMVVLILAIMVVAVEPKVTLFVLIATYVISGPVLMSFKALRPRLLRSGAGHRSKDVSPGKDKGT